jgi:hypothetical protein
MQAILFDMEDVGVGVTQNWEARRVVNRCQILEEKLFDCFFINGAFYLLYTVFLLQTLLN